jgi:hypothetical protein
MGVSARLIVDIACAPAAAACLSLAAGCGSSNHHSSADASTDSATDDAADLDAADADDTPEEPAFAPAAHRPWPQLQPNTGRTLSPMTLVTIVAANDTLASGLFAFGDAAIASSWWKQAGSEYGVGPAARSVHVNAPAITASMKTADVVQYIADAIGDAGAPAPDGKTLYLVYMPKGTGVTDVPASFAGFHNAYPGGEAGVGDGFAVVTRVAPGYGETELDELTLVASHEIMEAATDPGIDSWKLPDPPNYPWQGTVWSSIQAYGIECGDLCEGTRIHEPLDGGYEYQRIWSNAAARDGGDPCVPPIALPYENVSVPKDWYKVASGQSVAIPMTGWSTAPTGNWLVAAYNAYSTTAFAKVDYGAGVTIATDLGVGTRKNCYAFQAMNNGTNGILTVTAPAAAGAGDYIVVILQSFREGPGNCITPAADDYDHEWPVGVYVP